MSARGRKSDGKKAAARKKKGDGEKKSAPAAARDGSVQSRRLGLLVFGVAFLVLFAGVAIATGIGKPSLPDGAVAVVGDMPDGDEVITGEDFDLALEQMAAQMQMPEVPDPEDPQWNEVAQAALTNQLDIIWLKGEAAERGIDVSERQVRDQLDVVAAQEFECPADEDPFECEPFADYLEEANFTEEEVLELIEVGVMSNEILAEVTEEAPAPTDRQLRTFYDSFEDQFRVPASTDLRLIQNENAGPVRQALRQLREDSSPETWEEVAAEHSEDPLSSEDGGLREGVTEGMFEQAVQEAIDGAEPGELVGPIETDTGFYLIQVESRNPEGVQDFDEVREQLEQQVAQQLETETQTSFFTVYSDRWTSRTVCAEDRLLERCSNADGENSFLTAEAREQMEAAEEDQAPALSGKTVWPKPPNTMAPPLGAVSPTGTQIICYLEGTSEEQPFPPTGVAPPQRPHPPGPTADIAEVPEGVDPDQLPPPCGASDPAAMFGGAGGGVPVG